ncbi:MAG TPA: hypothetical protein DCP67_05320 [Planctomycetaceae bacterium]|nr:hypothetical protein [Planctomycetaceae bacterium]
MDVLQQFEVAPREIDEVIHGGFSGARIWKVLDHSGATFCLKRWPANGPTHQHLTWIHQVIHSVATNTEVPLAVPVASKIGSTVVSAADYQWDLTGWLPGEPASESITSDQVQAALRALALFHHAAQDHNSVIGASGLSRSIEYRREFADWLINGGVNEIAVCVGSCTSYAVILQAYRENAKFITRAIREMAGKSYALIPCLRDIWSDHVLFQETKVSGIIDYGAMRLDAAVVDIARLLGCYEAMNKGVWNLGIDAYREVRHISIEDVQLAEQLARVNVVLSAMQWLDWLFVRKREFADPIAVDQRIELLSIQLRQFYTA